MLRGAIVVFILGLIIAIYLSLPEGTLSLASVQRYQGQLQAWQAQRPLLVSSGYFLIYFLISALSIPGTRILTLLGGALFGIVEGTLLVASAASSGAVVAMLLSRYILRDWVQRRFAMMMNVINKGMADNGAYYLFAVRLVPVLPFSIINLLMGLTPFSTLRFMVITFVGLLPSIVLYIITGQKLSQIDSLSDILSPEIILLFMLLATLPLLSRWMLKRLNRG